MASLAPYHTCPLAGGDWRRHTPALGQSDKGLNSSSDTRDRAQGQVWQQGGAGGGWLWGQAPFPEGSVLQLESRQPAISPRPGALSTAQGSDLCFQPRFCALGSCHEVNRPKQ